jgi:hypothetical protein
MSKRKDGQPRGNYTLEFKLEAVRLVKGGQAAAVTAKVLGMPKQTLKNWVRLIESGQLRGTNDTPVSPEHRGEYGAACHAYGFGEGGRMRLKGMEKVPIALRKLIAIALILTACQPTAKPKEISLSDKTCTPINFNVINYYKDKKWLKEFLWRNSVSKEWDHYPSDQEWNQMQLIVVDLNGDKKNDVIYVPGKDYCGTVGCTAFAVIQTSGSTGYQVDISPGIHLSAPICVVRTESNNLFDIIVNKYKYLKFNYESKSYE